MQVKQPALQQKFYFQCKSPASSIIFYMIGISNAAEGRSRCVCLQNFLPFCQYIYLICWMAASSTLTPSTRGQ
ncbi:hypothetical protein SORBI_3009G060501 [Sorghum bicolor]|uniref:Uncharacterized protein n=1 Tax=Sorghum bicolor TaxID=4558 RepID=A0A1Z5R256_SORBI|nr:hypothetical protein SORBI_3009G060501 [Sorghum bicolor]